MGKTRCSDEEPRGGAPLPAGQNPIPRRFLTPSILLLLGEEPMHGYAILGKLVELGAVGKRLPLPVIYRELLQMEARKLVGFKFAKPEGRGPARKVYHLTKKGWKELSVWAESLKEARRFIDEFEKRYGRLQGEFSCV
ncbi:MAG: PadR family transcriptional regulator [Actinomycetota bacterium]|nr:PadR family transcriptional regulator [Actinomycetota bacterium]